jgi:hypothetical protein
MLDKQVLSVLAAFPKRHFPVIHLPRDDAMRAIFQSQ